MKIKSITTMGLAALALTAFSLAPADAHIRNNYVANRLAVNYAIANGAYNPVLAANYSQPVAYNWGYNPYNANVVSNQYNRLAQEASRISYRLATGNVSPREAIRLQNRLARIQAEENALSGNGYGYPYNGGLRRFTGV